MDKYEKRNLKTLFVWDESHYAQSKNQRPDKFLRKIGISADGDYNNLQENNNWFLSVSATPFSEYSDNYHYNQQKKIVYMHPGENYNSVKDMLTSGRIKSFENVEQGLRLALSTPHDTYKYGIIRISSKNEELILNIIKDFTSWQTVIYDSLSSGDIKKIGNDTWNGMENVPKKDTLILLRGKCRMGKNLEKRHVLFAMETAKNSNTDTVLQGLLGRSCGYSEGSKSIIVYIHNKIFRSGEIEKYINLTENQSVIPSKACNIIKVKTIKNKHPIVPFIIKNANADGESRRQLIKYICKKIDEPQFNFRNTDNRQFNEIRSKIRRYLDKDNSIEIIVHYVTKNLKDNENNLVRIAKWKKISKSLHHFMNSDDKQPMNLWFTGIDENKSNGEPLKEGRIINLFYYSESNEEYGIEAGSVFVYGVTEAPNEYYETNISIPKTTKREIFAHKLEDGTEIVSNGGYVIHLPFKTCNDANLMKKYLLKFAELSLQFPESRRITSQWDESSLEYKGITIGPVVKQALLPNGYIYKEIKSKYGFELKLNCEETINEMECSVLKRYASISW